MSAPRDEQPAAGPAAEQSSTSTETSEPTPIEQMTTGGIDAPAPHDPAGTPGTAETAGVAGTPGAPETPHAPGAPRPGVSAPRKGARAGVQRTRISGTWVAVIVAALVLLLLLIFILQNLNPVTVHLFGGDPSLPLGVALLLAAIGGALLVAAIGAARIMQLRRAAKRRVRR